MKYAALVAFLFVFAILAIVAIPINRVHADGQVILQTQGSPSSLTGELLRNAPTTESGLSGIFDGVPATDILFPEEKQLDSIHLWLAMLENPLPTGFYVEVRQGDAVMATSDISTVYSFDNLHIQEVEFPFSNANRITLVPGLPYEFVIRGVGTGGGSLGLASSVVDGVTTPYPYFQIYGEDPQASISEMGQTLVNGPALKEGRGLTGSSMTVQAKVWSATLSSLVMLQVELVPVGQPFRNGATGNSGWLDSGTLAQVTFERLTPGDYHWQARAVDQFGSASPWQEFGAAGNIDFNLDQTPNTVAGHWSDGSFPNGYCGFGTTPVVPQQNISLNSVDFWAQCINGSCNDPNALRIYAADGVSLLAESNSDQTFKSNSPIGVAVTQGFTGANRIVLLAGHRYQVTPYSANGTCAVDTLHGVQDTFYLRGATREPVVLVPGILGSALDRVSDGGEVWPDVNAMVASASDDYLDELKLDTTGAQMAGKELEPDAMIESSSFSVDGQNLVTQVLYGNLVKAFTDRGYILGKDLFEAPYDWRLDLHSSSAKLQEVVAAARSASPDGKINIVAHSMGGLLVKEYLSGLGDASFVNRVVLAGTPQLGAPSMFKVLNYGDDLGFAFPAIHKDLLSAAEVKDISQNMPGAYELLPSRRYVAVNGGYIQDFRNGGTGALSYDDTTALMTADDGDSRNAGLLSGAQDLHDSLDDQPIKSPQVYDVMACDNISTLGNIRLYDGGKIDIASTNGDGTVPLTSAVNLSDDYTDYFVSSRQTGIDHMGLVKDDRTTTLIERLAEGIAPSLPVGVSTSSAICFPQPSGDPAEEMFRFSTHSPVALSAYDSAGDHTGPAADGGIDTGIPGSSYEKLGENSFIFVPAGDTYHLLVNGLAQGQFTLKTEVLDGTSPIELLDYLNVPVAGTSTVGTLDFSGAGGEAFLSLDADGDGIIDDVLPPTSALSGDAAADAAPPDITVSGIPAGDMLPDEPFTVTFSAYDETSGVSLLSATLDGTPFASGDELTATTIGRHTIEIQATDNAGNPRIATYQFSVQSLGHNSCSKLTMM